MSRDGDLRRAIVAYDRDIRDALSRAIKLDMGLRLRYLLERDLDFEFDAALASLGLNVVGLVYALGDAHEYPLNQAFDRARTLDLATDHGRAAAHAADLARALIRGGARIRAGLNDRGRRAAGGALARAGLNYGGSRAAARALARTDFGSISRDERDLIRADLNHHRARDLDYARAYAGILGRVADRVRELTDDVAVLANAGRDLAQMVVQSEDASRRAGSTEPRHSVLADRLLGQAMRVVPVAHRDRYDEEFRSELDQLAEECGRSAQVGYALRVARQVWMLRVALRSSPHKAPRRIGAS